jgi:hypothetical protein
MFGAVKEASLQLQLQQLKEEETRDIKKRIVRETAFVTKGS